MSEDKKYFNVRLEFDKEKLDKTIFNAIETGKVGYVCSVESNNLTVANNNPDFLKVLNGALVNNCDGSVLAKILGKIHHEPLDSYIGADIFIKYVKMCKFRQFFLGNTPEVLEGLRNNLSRIDPKIKENKYPFTQLAGVGVVFKLIQAISHKLNIDEKEYLKYLDLVAIGTISDIVPLVDENRVIAKLGLKLVEVTKNIGLRTLINSLGYQKINSMCISFGVAPRINACGRIGQAEEALKLFLTQDILEAQKLTNELNEYNRARQEIEKRIYEDAIEKIENNNMKNNNCIVLSGENWHHGVIRYCCIQNYRYVF